MDIKGEISNDESLRHVFNQVMRLHFVRSHSLLEKTGVYPGQPPLLFSLYKHNGQSQRELADKLNVKASTIAVMIKRMEKTEVIVRKQDENDQRISRIFITDKGKEVCDKLKEIHEQIEEESFKNFTSEEKVLLRRLLIQVKDNLSEVCDRESKDMNFYKHHR